MGNQTKASMNSQRRPLCLITSLNNSSKSSRKDDKFHEIFTVDCLNRQTPKAFSKSTSETNRRRSAQLHTSSSSLCEKKQQQLSSSSNKHRSKITCGFKNCAHCKGTPSVPVIDQIASGFAPSPHTCKYYYRKPSLLLKSNQQAVSNFDRQDLPFQRKNDAQGILVRELLDSYKAKEDPTGTIYRWHEEEEPEIFESKSFDFEKDKKILQLENELRELRGGVDTIMEENKALRLEKGDWEKAAAELSSYLITEDDFGSSDNNTNLFPNRDPTTSHRVDQAVDGFIGNQKIASLKHAIEAFVNRQTLDNEELQKRLRSSLDNNESLVLAIKGSCGIVNALNEEIAVLQKRIHQQQVEIAHLRVKLGKHLQGRHEIYKENQDLKSRIQKQEEKHNETVKEMLKNDEHIYNMQALLFKAEEEKLQSLEAIKSMETRLSNIQEQMLSCIPSTNISELCTGFSDNILGSLSEVVNIVHSAFVEVDTLKDLLKNCEEGRDGLKAQVFHLNEQLSDAQKSARQNNEKMSLVHAFISNMEEERLKNLDALKNMENRLSSIQDNRLLTRMKEKCIEFSENMHCSLAAIIKRVDSVLGADDFLKVMEERERLHTEATQVKKQLLEAEKLAREKDERIYQMQTLLSKAEANTLKSLDALEKMETRLSSLQDLKLSLVEMSKVGEICNGVAENMSASLFQIVNMLSSAMPEEMDSQLRSIFKERDDLQVLSYQLTKHLLIAEEKAKQNEEGVLEARKVAEEKMKVAQVLEQSVQELDATVNSLMKKITIMRRNASKQQHFREESESKLQAIMHQLSKMQDILDSTQLQCSSELTKTKDDTPRTEPAKSQGTSTKENDCSINLEVLSSNSNTAIQIWESATKKKQSRFSLTSKIHQGKPKLGETRQDLSRRIVFLQINLEKKRIKLNELTNKLSLSEEHKRNLQKHLEKMKRQHHALNFLHTKLKEQNEEIKKNIVALMGKMKDVWTIYHAKDKMPENKITCKIVSTPCSKQTGKRDHVPEDKCHP